MKNKKLLLLMAMTAGTMMASQLSHADCFGDGYADCNGAGAWNEFSNSSFVNGGGASDSWDCMYGANPDGSCANPNAYPILQGAAPGPNSLASAAAEIASNASAINSEFSGASAATQQAWRYMAQTAAVQAAAAAGGNMASWVSTNVRTVYNEFGSEMYQVLGRFF